MLSLTELIIISAPTAGGQYYWVSILAPKTSRNFLSYITGTLVNSLSLDPAQLNGTNAVHRPINPMFQLT